MADYTLKVLKERYLELLKNDDNYDAKMRIPEKLKAVFDWWKMNIPRSSNPIRQGNYRHEIFSDASTMGLGAFYEGKRARGFWTEKEKNYILIG